MDILDIFIEFSIIFLVIYLLYYFFSIKKCKKNRRFIPVEVNLILAKYKIDIKKINLYQMIKVVCLVTSLILALSITIMNYLSKSIIISLLIGVCLSVVLAFIIYGFIGNYYKRKSGDS